MVGPSATDSRETYDMALDPPNLAPDEHAHDRGLALDLPTILSRRRLLGLLGAAGVAAAAGCASGGSDGAPAASASTAASAGAENSSAQPGAGDSTVEEGTIPEETGGPYPADGSNGVNVLTQSGVVRGDIRSSFGSGSATAEGVLLTVALTVVDVGNGSAPLEGAAIYLWHCDREGRYSLYSEGVTNENYLRGVQVADAQGKVSFTSIYPAAYDGRWPHIHFEVYPTVEAATTASDKLRTSQIALPEDASELVYATAGYEQSVQNLARTSLATDRVFSDGYSLQLGKVTGDVTSGLTVTLNVPV
jgi:protocatechuate 3,4-dioxygenase beta subunit